MAQFSKDTGVILALMQRFNEHRLPKILALKKRVEQGECLSEYDISDSNHAIPLIDKHPELQSIATRAISLYKEITEKALENEKQS
jgi:hypothetical protein